MCRFLILSVLSICIYPSLSSIESDVQALIQKIQDARPEPINITEVNITVPDNQIISGFLNLSHFNVTGLKAFDLKVKFALGLIPYRLTLNLQKLELDTDFLLQMPLFNLNFLKLFGRGNVHLSLSDFSLNADFQKNYTAPFTNLKLSLGAAQFVITGFLDDPDFSKELSEDLTAGIQSTVNSDDFAALVQNVLNAFIASLVNKTSLAQVSPEEFQMNDDMATEKSLYIIDLLSTFRMLIENAFRDYRSMP